MFGATVGATAGALVSTQGALKRTVAAVRYSTLATGLMLLAMYPEVTTAMLRAIENSLTLTCCAQVVARRLGANVYRKPAA
eukprot:COSAG05_NODE_2772_length_2660_cov_4.593518_1_plen_81_part_00